MSGTEPMSDGVVAPVLLKALGVVLGLEAIASIALVGYLILEIIDGRAAVSGGSIALIGIAVIAAIFLVALTIATFRARPWIRGAVVTWQLIQIACAIGCFQGILAVPSVGWALLVPALIALVLLFTPSVVAATRRV
ncbi:hypothetical protein [Naasia lichenicola]|uniref:Histidine kinase n=1 Tax=Naasia lichenicola TaxID=2565933 RepID=A0A4S4FN71_9MICO|nr:hypothetical protein [Naasia lichenicola]THG30652.1 hypothetical protein E6C64_08410 [Naasia lichenicola]THG31889.1 hypothetical protein E6C64_07555 [Naasia lichenicola]